MRTFYMIVFFFSCLNIYSQTRIDGPKTVNFAQNYTYRGYLPGVDILTNITWRVVNGRFNNPDGPTSSTQTAGAPMVDVVWDDAETGKLYITINSILYVGIDVEIKGIKNISIPYFVCNGSKVTNNIINIAQGQTGTLNCSVPTLYFPSGIAVKKYKWTLPKSWGGGTYYSSGNLSIKFDATSGNNETITVTPMGYKDALGNPITITIKRTVPVFDGNIINTTISSNKTYEHSNLYLQGVVVKSGANVVLNGYNSVRIVPGFTAELGSTIRIYNGSSSKSKSVSDDLFERNAGATEIGSIDYLVATLEQNIPNPAFDNTAIRCYVPESSTASFIQIYDMLGNQIRKLPLTVGENEITIQKGELPPGIYVYSLIVDGKLIDSKRMIVNK